MTGEIATQSSRRETIQKCLLTQKSQIAAALPKILDQDRFLRIALTELRKTPALLNCTPESYVGAVMQSAQLGLELGSGLGHAWLVPYKTEVQFQIGYKGFLELAYRSGRVSSIQARVVYSKDVIFDYEFGSNPAIKHKPTLEADRGEFLAAYAVCHFKDGSNAIDIMSKAEIDKIKGRSPAQGRGPWVTDEDEMRKKTVLKRLCKTLNLSVELSSAITVDDEYERGTQNNGAIFSEDGKVYKKHVTKEEEKSDV